MKYTWTDQDRIESIVSSINITEYQIKHCKFIASNIDRLCEKVDLEIQELRVKKLKLIDQARRAPEDIERHRLTLKGLKEKEANFKAPDLIQRKLRKMSQMAKELEDYLRSQGIDPDDQDTMDCTF